MTEIRTLVRPVRVEKKCECGGLLQYTGQSMSSGFSSEHWHRCNSNCGAMQKFPVRYPRIEYEDVSELSLPPEECVKVSLGGWYVTEENVIVIISGAVNKPGEKETTLFLDQGGRAYLEDGTNVLRYAATPFPQEFVADNIVRPFVVSTEKGHGTMRYSNIKTK